MKRKAPLLAEGDVFCLTADHTFCTPSGSSEVKLDRCPRYAGEYVVYKTTLDGGGEGHGPHDTYPDGHHVFAEHLASGALVDFYQSGSFTAVNENVPVVRRMVRKWVNAN